MRSKFLFCALLIGCFFSINPTIAQVTETDPSKIKVSQLSDEQILALDRTREERGITEADAIKYLIQRGMDPEEAENYKKRLEALKASGKTIRPGTQTATIDNVKAGRDTLKITDPKPVKRESRIYGIELFSNPNLKFEPNIRIATPKGYIIGPDDELNIFITGLNERPINGKVTPDGFIRIPNIGLVYVSGLTIERATEVIRGKAQKIYPALISGQTRLNVTLGSVRSIRVNIIGEVVKPGNYTISSLSSLFNAMYDSGGPNRFGSLRNIEIIRGNRRIKTVDLYSFIQTGIMADNIRLEDQDVIRVPAYTKRVAIEGSIKRSGIFELKAEETITDLISYAGGFADNAYKGIAKISQIGEKERSIKDVPAAMFDRYVLKNADSIYIGAILERYNNRVSIEGAVYRPGPYELSNGLTVKQLISNADGLRDDAALENAYIKRTNPNLDKEQISFNLRDIVSGARQDIPLMKEDTLVINSRQELKNNLTVTIDGNVKNPSTFTYRKGMTVTDILAMANGFTPEAATHRIEISRLVVDKSDSISNRLITSINVSLDSAMRGSQSALQLEPLDYIYVPRLVNYRALGNVKIRGEVLFPGDYPLTRRDETGPEFIQRAGGITPIGSLENAQVFRNGTRVDIDLTGSDNRKKLNSIIFMEGDSVFVPRKMPFVEVAGAVNTPQLLSFVNSNFNYYINAAGGLTETARLRSAYVQYPNGTNQPVKRFLFFKNYPKIFPGSKIVVPENKALKVKLSVGEISAIASALTALVTVIAILVK
ncbi:MAG: hypothetical protein EOO89_07775 [Pedobacter sp.]|nr:MAG: hypothetical protein EOO89_07775 [Pedobacter sp.]